MANPSSVAFADALEECIRTSAQAAADSFPTWGSACMPPTEKIDLQAAVLAAVLPPIRAKYGYAAALWCSFYSVRMTGAEFDPNDTQPNNPNFFDWYASLLCPWEVEQCGYEPLGLNGNEWEGVPVAWVPLERQNAQYMTEMPDLYSPSEPDRRTMSCGLCGHLKRQLGAPPFTVEPPPIAAADAAMYTANWDMHPFGSWLANDAALNRRSSDEQVASINTFKTTNGEEMHGYLWQSVRLLAYDNGMLSGARKDPDAIDAETGELHVMRVCQTSWHLAPQTRDDCSHAAGHGFFYYYMDVGRAVSSCWASSIVHYAPGLDADQDQDTRTNGLNAKDLLKWRWLCSTGVYHAAGNTLSVEVLAELVAMPGMTAEAFLCKHANVWGDDDRYFDRCAAGLGIKETEGRLGLVASAQCAAQVVGVRADGGDVVAPPRAWEARQLQQRGQTMQLSCNPAKYFVVANDQCPFAFKANFPCDPAQPDYDFCTGASGGAVVYPKVSKVPTPYHKLCGSHAMIRDTFKCTESTYHTEFNPKGKAVQVANNVGVTPGAVTPHVVGQNWALYSDETNWEMGTPIGVWGGKCTCPDGQVFTAGDEGNNCDSIACRGGIQGECQHGEGIWAFKEVHCEAPGPSGDRPEVRALSLNTVVDDAPGVGAWGGSCLCPDGSEYLVGDLAAFAPCEKLACDNGTPGICSRFASVWSHRKVVCAGSWEIPSPPPPAPLPPPPAPPPSPLSPPSPGSPPPPSPPPPPPNPDPRSPPPSPPPPSPSPRPPPPLVVVANEPDHIPSVVIDAARAFTSRGDGSNGEQQQQQQQQQQRSGGAPPRDGGDRLARANGGVGRSAVEGAASQDELQQDEFMALALAGVGATALLLLCCGACLCFCFARRRRQGRGAGACAGGGAKGGGGRRYGRAYGDTDADEEEHVIDGYDDCEGAESRQPRDKRGGSRGGRKVRRGSGGRGRSSSRRVADDIDDDDSELI